jgi:outer membrane protein OmpA-like peptidoglycan-associated protein
VSLASRWRFDVLNSTGHWTGTIAFKRDGKTVTGTWFTDQFGAEEPLTNITLTSGEVSFTRPRAGQDFRGVISNGTMTGTFTWSGRDWDWKATLLDSTDLHQVRGVTASASSVCAPDRFRYDPELAVDGDPKTAWFPRRTDRTNRGQWIRFELARAVPVEGMVLVNGWAESELNWRSNSRVKEADLTTSAGDRVRIQLRDSSLPQWFWLPGKSPVGWIQLTVVDSHHGDRASEAGITDVVLYGPEAPAPALVVVEGVVLDERSHAGVEAEVVAEDPATGEIQARGTSARESGGWQLRLPPGRPYVVSYRKSGYFFGSQRIEVPAGGAHHVIRQEGTMVPLREGASLALVDTFFVTGRSELTPEGGFGLAKVVELLRQNPALRLEVGGHTDNVGSAEANLGLSQDRATAVRDFLVARGIAGTRLKARGYGATQPRADNATAEGRALNRRTELRVLEGAP